MKALILGATGATGSDLLEQVLNDPQFNEVCIFVRREVKIESPKLKVEVVDFDNPEHWKNLVSGDVAFSCMGTTLKAAGNYEAQYKVDYTYQYNFAKAAKENGVQDYILVSAYGANSKSRIPYSKMKGELEDSVKALHFDKITIFQPGMLDREDTDRSNEAIGVKVLSALNKIGLFKSQKPLPTDILAKAMVNAAKIKSNGLTEIKLCNIFSFAEKTLN